MYYKNQSSIRYSITLNIVLVSFPLVDRHYCIVDYHYENDIDDVSQRLSHDITASDLLKTLSLSNVSPLFFLFLL